MNILVVGGSLLILILVNVGFSGFQNRDSNSKAENFQVFLALVNCGV